MSNNKFEDFFEIVNESVFNELKVDDFLGLSSATCPQYTASLSDGGKNTKIKIHFKYTDDSQIQNTDYVEFAYLTDPDDAGTRAVEKYRISASVTEGSPDTFSSFVLDGDLAQYPNGGDDYNLDSAVNLLGYFQKKILYYLGNHHRKSISAMTADKSIYSIDKWAATSANGSTILKDGLNRDIAELLSNVYYYKPSPCEMAIHAIIKDMTDDNTTNTYKSIAQKVDANFYQYLNTAITCAQKNVDTTDRWTFAAATTDLANNLVKDIAGFVLKTDATARSAATLNIRFILTYLEQANLFSGSSNSCTISFKSNLATYNSL